MKITTSRKDDILKRKSEWQSEYDAQKAEYDSQRNALDRARTDQEQSLISTIEQYLSEFKLDLSISAYPGRFGSPGYEVTIYCNQTNKFSDDVSLSWDYRLNLDEAGTVHSETGSWSGLKATTAAQLADLKESVRCIELIQNMDWANILNVKRPKYEDYITTPLPTNRSKEFDDELLLAEIEDIIGTNKVVEYDNPKYYRGETYVGIISQTNSMFNIFEIHSSEIGKKSYEDASRYPYKVRKSTFFDYLTKPLNIKEI